MADAIARLAVELHHAAILEHQAGGIRRRIFLRRKDMLDRERIGRGSDLGAPLGVVRLDHRSRERVSPNVCDVVGHEGPAKVCE